jgi:ADP-heptose:LPS heptosyltransferase
MPEPVSSSQPSSVRRIAVFRALQLGDMLCAVPALRALRRAHPQTQITLIGLPWAADWVLRMRHVDRFFAFPGWPGLPEQRPELAQLPAFIERMQGCRFDLALQMHGAGNIVNPLVATFGARESAGFHRAGEYCPDPWRFIEWPHSGHEIERCLALTDALGVPRAGLDLEFPLLPTDHVAVARRWPQLDRARFVCVHPGAQLPSRRWPVERFAQVVSALTEAGLRVVLTGTAQERGLAEALIAHLAPAARAAVFDLLGQTSLWQLGALLARARLLVCNDTGVSHVAAALRTPSVVVSCGAETARWAPLDHRLHTVLAHPVSCRPCAHRACPTGHECALGVTPAAVIDAAFAQLARAADQPVEPSAAVMS